MTLSGGGFERSAAALSSNNLGQVVHTRVPLLSDSTTLYQRKPGRKQAHHAMHYSPVYYPWSRSVSWCPRDTEMEISAAPLAQEALEEMYYRIQYNTIKEVICPSYQ